MAAVHADVEVGNSRNSTQDVAWGPLVFEARRFVELRKKSLWQQFKSAESFGMGLYYTLNVSQLTPHAVIYLPALDCIAHLLLLLLLLQSFCLCVSRHTAGCVNS